MSKKLSLTVALVSLLVLFLMLALWIARPSVARAQCGDITSTCYKCHQEVHPVCGTTEWHSVYGHRYACWNCHGGNDTAQDKEQAHVGLVVNPLAEAYTSCYTCHPDNYQQLAQRFAQEIGVPVSFDEPVTPASQTIASVLTLPLAASSAVTTPIQATNTTDRQQFLWLLPLAAVLPLGWFIWRRRIL